MRVRFWLIFILTYQTIESSNNKIPYKTQIVYPKSWKLQLNNLQYDLISTDVNNLFFELTHLNVFADKSMLIAKLFNGPDVKNILITEPRKWGKSTNLDMIGRFLEMEVDSDGNAIPQEQAQGYKLFVQGISQSSYSNKNPQYLSQKLLISNEQDIINQHLGKYSVIRMNLILHVSSNLNPTEINYDTFYKDFQDKISDLFQSKQYVKKILKSLIQSDKKNSKLQKLLKNFEQLEAGNAHNSIVLKSLHILSNCLHVCFKDRETIILIDEYDYVYNTMFFDNELNFYDMEANRISQFLKTFMIDNFRRLQPCFHLKVIMTGISKLSKLNLFTGMSNFEEWSMTSSTGTYPFYGITLEEVDELIKLRGFDEKDRQLITMKYDGYHDLSNLPYPIYNPISIIRYFNTRRYDHYWVNTGSSLNKELPKFFSNIQMRLALHPLLLNMDNYITVQKSSMQPTLSDLQHIGNLIRGKHNNEFLQQNVVDGAFCILLTTGYLSVYKTQPSDATLLNIKIPNDEIRYFFNGFFQKYIYHTLGKYSQLMMNAAVALDNYITYNNDETIFAEVQKSLSRLFDKSDIFQKAVTEFEPVIKEIENENEMITGFTLLNEAAAHHVIFNVLLALKEMKPSLNLASEFLYDYYSPILRKYVFRIDLIISKMKTVLIIELKSDYELDLGEIMDQGKQYLLLFRDQTIHKTFKILAINVLHYPESNRIAVQSDEEILSREDVDVYCREWNDVERIAIKLLKEDIQLQKKDVNDADALAEWKDLPAKTARRWIKEAKKLWLKENNRELSHSLPMEFVEKIPENLRRDPREWEDSDMDSFLDLCGNVLKIEIKKHRISPVLLVDCPKHSYIFDRLCPGNGYLLYNAFQYMMKHYTTTSTPTSTMGTPSTSQQPGRPKLPVLHFLFDTLAKPDDYSEFIIWKRRDTTTPQFLITDENKLVSSWSNTPEMMKEDRDEWNRLLMQLHVKKVKSSCVVLKEVEEESSDGKKSIWYRFIYNVQTLNLFSSTNEVRKYLSKFTPIPLNAEEDVISQE